MAQHTTVTDYCDLDHGGEEIERSDNIAFSLGSDDYEVDACPEHAAHYRGILNALAAAGRPRVTRLRHAPGPARRDQRRMEDRVKSSVIRAWAVEQGIEISAKGRIPDAIIARYHAEHDNHPELAEAV